MLISKKVKILEQYSDLIWQIIHKYNTPTNMWDDAYSHCKLSLLQSLDKYDKNKSKLITYIYIIVSQALQKWMYKSQYPYGMSWATYLKYTPKTEQINMRVLANKQVIEQPYSIEQREQVIKIFCRELNTKLTDADRDIVIDFYLDNLSYKELKDKYGNVYKRISTIIPKYKLDKILDKIKEEINE
jgi:RNA polymerase sigma factor (sigma-70 family)